MINIDKNGFYGGKFGGNYVAETLKKPIDDLTKLFEKYRKDKNFIKERDNLYKITLEDPRDLSSFKILLTI